MFITEARCYQGYNYRELPLSDKRNWEDCSRICSTDSSSVWWMTTWHVHRTLRNEPEHAMIRLQEKLYQIWKYREAVKQWQRKTIQTD